jgi:hypothetical protein
MHVGDHPADPAANVTRLRSMDELCAMLDEHGVAFERPDGGALAFVTTHRDLPALAVRWAYGTGVVQVYQRAGQAGADRAALEAAITRINGWLQVQGFVLHPMSGELGFRTAAVLDGDGSIGTFRLMTLLHTATATVRQCRDELERAIAGLAPEAAPAELPWWERSFAEETSFDAQ